MATYSMSSNDHTDIKLRMSRESEKQELQEKLNNSSSGVPERFFLDGGALLPVPREALGKHFHFASCALRFHENG